MRSLSRRGFLGSAAGIAAAATLPPSSSAQAAITPLAGACVNPGGYGVSSYLDAAKIYNRYVGLPLATTIEKVYMGHGQFGLEPPAKMTQLAAAGCQFLVSIEPSRTMTPTELSRLAAWLDMLNKKGMSYRVVLYAECNNKAFTTAEEWLAYWRYYAPTVQRAGVTCGYDPGCGHASISRAEAYFPSNPLPDELWMDYYATAFRDGSRIDKLMAIARAAGIPAGMAEWGWSAGQNISRPMTMPWWNQYCTYLIHLATEGNLKLGAIHFSAKGNGLTVDVISSASDPRIPMIQKLANTVQTAS